MKVIKIKDEIYHTHIFVIPKSNEDDLVKYFKKKYRMEYVHENDSDGIHFSVINVKQGIDHHYLIFDNFENSAVGIGIFNHELLHMVFNSLEVVGMKFSNDSEEAYTYFAGYLTEKILDKLC